MDSLRKSVNRLDRERARHHRLTGEVVLPSRGDSSTRRVCSACFHVVDEQAERKNWEDETRAAHQCAEFFWWSGRTGCDGHWNLRSGKWDLHIWGGVTACPKCGGGLAEVTW